MNRQQEAVALCESKLLREYVDGRTAALYSQWLSATTIDEREQLHLDARAVLSFKHALIAMAQGELEDGGTTDAAA